jgi:glycyl-tRNA synthetase beta chain
VAELLLELLSEEIPARMQARAAADLKRLVTDGLKAAGLTFDDARAYATPRRLALVVNSLPERQPDVSEEKKGPKVGAPDQAVQGFMKANGLTDISEAEVRETPKGDFYFVARQIAGRPTAEVLPDLLVEAIRTCPWPKSMRWLGSGFRWVRPLHAILALFDGRALEGGFDLGDGTSIEFGTATRGHRFLAPDAFTVTSFTDYQAKLRAAKVVLEPAERKAIVSGEAAKLAAAEDLKIKDDPGLLDEVAGLVEWPVVLMGTIDEHFMNLPPEVLTTTMRTHQKYFPTLGKKGALADRFVLVANMETADGGAAIVAGNERVLRARLADARFFWDQDRKRSLASRAPDLAQIVFHAKLGSLDAKADRMQALAAEIAKHIPGADTDRVRSAARLAKADLTTGMVGEFPELQGVMGRYYALADGEHAKVADKIDTLAGFWAIDEKPTGSKDPYALRRAALGVIRLIVENELRLPLTQVVETARRLYRDLDGPSVAAPLLDFFADRLKVALRDKGVRHDLISAVFALGGEDDLVRLLKRVKALEDFLGSDDGEHLLVAYRRAANIVRIEEKKDGVLFDGAADAARFVREQETALSEALGAAAETAEPALADEDFTKAMGAMARLRSPVDDFFDHVTVNAEDTDLRTNRLRLLNGIGATLGRVADFSRIEG